MSVLLIRIETEGRIETKRLPYEPNFDLFGFGLSESGT